MCCDLCWKEFKGWCNSFTRTEKALTILEAILLVILITSLIFLILHLLACSSPILKYEKSLEESEEIEEYQSEEIEESQSKEIEDTTGLPVATTKHRTTKRPTTKKFSTKTTTETKTTKATTRQTIDPDQECSWTPSAKTTAFTHYYEKSDAKITEAVYTTTKVHTKKPKFLTKTTKQHYQDTNIDFIQVDQSDGEYVEPEHNKYILSLVKLKPPQGVVFGCILTIINNFYVMTSASCIEAIEEVDSLDSFVIMEEYGSSSNGKIHNTFDLQIHPFYQGTNKSYDLAVIKSQSSLVNGQAVELPTTLDYSMITIGQRFYILGFGAYRSIDKSSEGRSLRKAFVYRLPALQCPGTELWSLRHLEPGRPVPLAPWAVPAICAGVLYARGLPCNFCSGTPLLQGKVLIGLMSDNQQCGVACEPQLYVNIAAVRDWIDSVVKGE